MSDEIKKMLVAMLASLIDGLDSEKVEDFAGKFYDENILPLELPGPDELIDPMLRKAFMWSAVALFDAIRQQILDNKS